ncbi:MAG: SPOR domain-containing protein [Candidatus Omnitrophica bacterium]|nr:SPOR domain-containing protein [Candidatus Omnitrophota bacterium]
MKRHKRKNHASISEKDIKSKLYGQSKKEVQEEIAQQPKITEKDIMKKLYPDQKKTYTAQEKKEKPADLFNNKDLLQPGIAEEINTLKQAISSLEDKLKMSINQKERLKVKLIQKRKLINIRERLADLILNRMPEKFIILLIVFLIFVIFMVMKSLRPATAPVNDASQTRINFEEAPSVKSEPAKAEVVKNLPGPQPEAITRKRYTIQAAEYADEEAARHFVNALKKQGYLVMIDTIYRDKEKKKAYFKINVGAYDTLNEAKEFNEIFRKKTNIKDSFIKELKR